MTEDERVSAGERSRVRNVAGCLVVAATVAMTAASFLAASGQLDWSPSPVLLMSLLIASAAMIPAVVAPGLRRAAIASGAILLVWLVGHGGNDASAEVMRYLLSPSASAFTWGLKSTAALIVVFVLLPTSLRNSAYSLPYLRSWAMAGYWLVLTALLLRLAVLANAEGMPLMVGPLLVGIVLGALLAPSRAGLLTILVGFVVPTVMLCGIVVAVVVKNAWGWPGLALVQLAGLLLIAASGWGVSLEYAQLRWRGITPLPNPVPQEALVTHLDSDEAQEGADKYTRE